MNREQAIKKGIEAIEAVERDRADGFAGPFKHLIAASVVAVLEACKVIEFADEDQAHRS